MLMKVQEWDQMGESVTKIMRNGGGLPDLQSSLNPLVEVSTESAPLGCTDESN